MKTLHQAELRGSWLAWLSVSLTFVTTNLCLGVAALFALSGQRAGENGILPDEEAQAFVAGGIMNIVTVTLVGMVIIGSSTSLVIDSRRGSLARLALVGATPGQVVATLLSQLVVVSLATAVIADLLVIPALPATLAYEAAERGTATPPAQYDVGILLAANALCVLVALIGGYRQARRATRIPPVEALRQSTTESRGSRGIAGWIVAVLCAGAVAYAIASVESMGREAGPRSASSMVLQGSVIVLLLTGVALALTAAVSVSLVTKLWTSLLPIPDAAWRLARTTVVVRGDRFRRSVIPVMFAVGMLFGIMCIGDSFNATLAAAGGHQLEHSSATAMMGLLALPLAVAIAGAVGSLVMMSRQRDAELALAGLIGATPAQQYRIPCLEAVIITVTASLLGLVMAVMPLIYLTRGMPTTGLQFHARVPYLVLLATMLLCGIVIVAAVLVPSLASLRKPAPKVIARLIAD